jgi:ribosomal protein L7/L12
MQHITCQVCGAPVQPRALSCPYCATPFVRAAPDGTTAEQIAARLDLLMAGGKKLEAIKFYRELYGTSLADARDGVEAFWARRSKAPVD